MGHFAIEQELRIEEQYPKLFSVMQSQSPHDMMEAAKTIAVYANSKHITDIDRIIEDVDPIYFTYMWRKHRVIYQIDASLAEVLLQQACRVEDAEKIPCELLTSLPYDCISVETPPFEISTKETNNKYTMRFTGRFFLSYQEKTIMGYQSLMGVWEMDEGKLSEFYIPIVPDGTIKDSIDALHSTLVEGMPEMDVTEDDAKVQLAPVLFAMQIVLYLQAQNADVQRVPNKPKKKKSKTKSVVRKNSKPPKVVYVGYRVGRILRDYDEAAKSTSTGTGTPKRPHSRRGHWHHFWTGAKDKPAERRLVLQWVAPTMVHGEQPNETTTVVKIKGKP